MIPEKYHIIFSYGARNVVYLPQIYIYIYIYLTFYFFDFRVLAYSLFFGNQIQKVAPEIIKMLILTMVIYQ